MPKTSKPKSAVPLTLNACADGVIELWRGDELIGQIEATEAGLSVILGDADPGGGLTFYWTGEPFRINFAIPGQPG